MIEQLTLVLATPIVKAILDKFYEGVGTKLGEKAVELLPEKVKQLGQLVWVKCLRGKPGTEEMLQQAANGSDQQQQRLAQYLHQVLETDVTLRQEAQKLAEEIHQVVQFEDVNARNVQQVFGGQGLQVNDPKSQVIQAGDNAKFYFGAQPND
ncbi:MAG: hypothetical protein IGS54_05600 [Elainella sp. C42_A2020_010]|nr:hypothetical protein [Elainella sp. C42_A2020_010]